MKHVALTVMLLAALPFTAHAVEYKQIQSDKSTLGFGYKQMGVTMDGKFRKFSSQLSFDPAKVASAKATLDVELASIDTGSSEADQEVGGKLWFNTKAYPIAHFVSSSVKAIGGNRYEVTGKLTMKGRTQDVVAPVTLTPQGNQAIFDGTFSFKRVDFAIGEGAWSAFDTIANEIQVKFHILANTGK